MCANMLIMLHEGSDDVRVQGMTVAAYHRPVTSCYVVFLSLVKLNIPSDSDKTGATAT